MGSHPSGDGVAWDSLEAVDVDQPHGLDYRYAQHLAKAVRKRNDKEHEGYGDTTAGGEHLPGKCGVMLVHDDTADFTAYIDSTTAPLGSMAYCISNAELWCMTATASGGSPDATIVKLGRSSLCLGDDMTFTGALEVDGSIDFTSTVWFDDSVDVVGQLACGTNLAVVRDLTVGGKSEFDGTSNFNDGVAFGAEISVDGVAKFDNTAAEFGGTAGIGLFWDPTASPSGESCTLPNGLILIPVLLCLPT